MPFDRCCVLLMSLWIICNKCWDCLCWPDGMLDILLVLGLSALPPGLPDAVTIISKTFYLRWQGRWWNFCEVKDHPKPMLLFLNSTSMSNHTFHPETLPYFFHAITLEESTGMISQLYEDKGHWELSCMCPLARIPRDGITPSNVMHLKHINNFCYVHTTFLSYFYIILIELT